MKSEHAVTSTASARLARRDDREVNRRLARARALSADGLTEQVVEFVRREFRFPEKLATEVAGIAYLQATKSPGGPWDPSMFHGWLCGLATQVIVETHRNLGEQLGRDAPPEDVTLTLCEASPQGIRDRWAFLKAIMARSPKELARLDALAAQETSGQPAPSRPVPPPREWRLSVWLRSALL